MSSLTKGNAPEGRSSGASGDTTNVRKESIVRNSTQAGCGRVITAPFHGTQLYVVEHEGQPYTPMKPIVEGMGLTWQPQHRKLTAERFSTCVTEMVIQVPGDDQSRSVTCMSLRKLPGWLMGIETGKIKSPQVRARVIQYQNECDDALWKYWNDGVAVRDPKPDGSKRSNPQDRLPLYHFVVDTGIRHKLMFNKVYALLNLFAGTRNFQEMTKEQTAAVANFCDRFALGQDTRNDWQRIADNQALLFGEPKQLDMVQKLLLS